jgi:hypothetical protein
MTAKRQVLCELTACVDDFTSVPRVTLKRRSGLRQRFTGFENFEDYVKAHPESYFRFDSSDSPTSS